MTRQKSGRDRAVAFVAHPELPGLSDSAIAMWGSLPFRPDRMNAIRAISIRLDGVSSGPRSACLVIPYPASLELLFLSLRRADGVLGRSASLRFETPEERAPVFCRECRCELFRSGQKRFSRDLDKRN